MPPLKQMPEGPWPTWATGGTCEGAVCQDSRPHSCSALHQVGPPRRVAGVAVVVAGPEVPLRVERELLRVAQARREQLEAGPVRVAAHHAARVGIVQDPLDVDAAVADREIELPVGPEPQAVE